MTRSTGRDELTDAAADAAIEQACRILRLPTIREHHARVAEAAARQKAGYKGFLVELLAIECDEREDRRKARLVREAGFPRPKRLDDFDFTANPLIDPGLIHTLAKGAWVRAGQPAVPDRRLRHREVPPADRAGHRRRRGRLPGPLRHRRRPGQRTRRSRRRQTPLPHHRPLRPGRPALPRRAGLPGTRPPRRRAAVPGVHRTRGTRLGRGRVELRVLRLGHAPSPTPGSAPRSSTGSPSTPTSSRPAPSPTGCAPASANTPRPPPARDRERSTT